MEFFQSQQVPPPGGHYSQSVAAGGLVFVSGILPGKPDPDASGPDDFEQQVKRTLLHCKHVLASANCRLKDVVQCTAYIVGVDRSLEFNTYYAEFFGDHKPARAVVPVPELHYGFLVEIQIVAERRP